MMRALPSMVSVTLVLACGSGGSPSASASSSASASAPRPAASDTSKPKPSSSATTAASTAATPAPSAPPPASASAPAPAVPTIEEACARLATATCERHAGCDQGYLLRLDYGDAETCKSAVSAQCLDSARAPEAAVGAADVQACADALAKTPCDGARPAACRFKGKRADAAACSVDAQCQSGICWRGADTEACGTCKKAPVENDACKLPRDCYPDFTCTSSKCVPRAQEGGACAADHQCITSHCAKGRCGPYVKDGAACDTESDEPRFCHFAYGCEGKKCGPRKLVALGEKCGMGQGPFCMRSQCEYRQHVCVALP
ncbi:MAG: hypothetical protein IT373_27730, partial [Polyangiaceae bacterium]|nr:hypothetical protein [Polyangiaceae bacterium]